MKCSEERPKCAQCQKSDRECIYEDHVLDATAEEQEESVPSSSVTGERRQILPPFTPVSPTPLVLPARSSHIPIRQPSPEPPVGSRPEDDPRYQFTPPPPEAAEEIRKHRQSESVHKPLTPNLANLTVDNIFADVVPNVGLPSLDPPNAGLSPANTETTHASSNLISAELASIRWLGLLAADAAQSEPNFSLSPFITTEDGISGRLALQQQASTNQHGYQASSMEGPGGSGYRDLDQLLYAVDVQANPSNERKLWQSQERIKLTEQEMYAATTMPIFDLTNCRN
ncbi:hypothetical protein ABW20_dc0101786 [Dactylellina cionopaga]|nr:hypothetical protein ABW20_dc0101786 [Dactylellina cionopaga]